MPTEFPPVEVPAAWLEVLAALQRHGVQFVVAGSAADAIVEGDPESAAALIVAPAPFRRNFERLAAALGEFPVRIRVGSEESGETQPLAVTEIVNHPAVRWRLRVAGTEVDVIGSAVGDGEFSIRLWRTKAIELTGDGPSVTAEVELANAYTTAATS